VLTGEGDQAPPQPVGPGHSVAGRRGGGQAQTVNFGTRDTEEAMQAFAERTPPRFEGR